MEIAEIPKMFRQNQQEKMRKKNQTVLTKKQSSLSFCTNMPNNNYQNVDVFFLNFESGALQKCIHLVQNRRMCSYSSVARPRIYGGMASTWRWRLPQTFVFRITEWDSALSFGSALLLHKAQGLFPCIIRYNNWKSMIIDVHYELETEISSSTPYEVLHDHEEVTVPRCVVLLL